LSEACKQTRISDLSWHQYWEGIKPTRISDLSWHQYWEGISLDGASSFDRFQNGDDLVLR